jgi:hypothetical protein
MVYLFVMGAGKPASSLFDRKYRNSSLPLLSLRITEKLLGVGEHRDAPAARMMQIFSATNKV